MIASLFSRQKCPMSPPLKKRRPLLREKTYQVFSYLTGQGVSPVGNEVPSFSFNPSQLHNEFLLNERK